MGLAGGPKRPKVKMDRLSEQINPLLDENVLEALRSKQIYTVLDFLNADTQKIMKIARLTFQETLAVKNKLLKDFSAPPINGLDYYKTTLNNAAIISTGNESIDDLLGGGLYTGHIYEICGRPVSGKTHFALALIKNVALKMEQNAYFFDTKNSFSARKLKNMIDGDDDQAITKCLSKIQVVRAYSKSDLINGLYELKNNLKAGLKLRLIVIDSLPAVVLDSKDTANRNSFINNLVNLLRYISMEHHIAVLITNLIISWADFKNPVNKETIVCGKYWGSVPNTRVKIVKLETQDKCTISVLKRDFNSNISQSVNVSLTSQGFS